MRYLLDTHVWVWWNSAPRQLSPRIRRLLSASSGYEELLLSAISVWEFCKLVEKGRIGLSCAVEEWVRTALEMPKLRLVPLTPRIAYSSTALPAPFHGDPADQIIVATAREENATLLTKDQRLLSYPHIRAVW